MRSITVKPPRIPPSAAPGAAAVFGPISWVPGMYGFDEGPANRFPGVADNIITTPYEIEVAICPGAVLWRFEADSGDFSMYPVDGMTKVQGWIPGESCLCWAISADGQELGPLTYTVSTG
jgi:hypothetical protein